ncbi:F0F1 ATP synthase subunit B [Campylobacter sputorum]|uniref:F0F1 ATP synthase subunit B n=1 Tax=Campylobacter sputorum TaxID=206 RepID=UPI00053BF947|nr:F0F1 ATP synthase subunit B [Campylobacter sputorum]
MKKTILFFLCVPVFIFSSTHDGPKDYDIVPRAINFIIFAAILYYLIAQPLKNFFRNRSNGIAKRLEAVSEKLKDLKNKKEAAIKRVDDANVLAKDFINTAHKEAENLKKGVEKDLSQDIANLIKNYDNQKEFEKRKMTKEVVCKVLDEIFTEKNLKLDQGDLVDIVLKKVG